MGFLLLEQDHTPRMGTSHTSWGPGGQDVEAAHQGNSLCSSPCQSLSAELEEEVTEECTAAQITFARSGKRAAFRSFQLEIAACV